MHSHRDGPNVSAGQQGASQVDGESSLGDLSRHY